MADENHPLRYTEMTYGNENIRPAFVPLVRKFSGTWFIGTGSGSLSENWP